MDVTKIIKATAVRGRTSTAAPIIKEDYGLYLLIGGIDLPEVYEVDFSNDEHAGTSVTMVGNADGVLIPTQFIKSGKDVFAFYYHVGEDFGRTLYTIRIPNKLRPDRTDEEPTPEEQSVIDQAISALNTAVAKTAQDVVSADESARSASDDADRAERARTGAETAQGKAEEAQESAERAKDDAETSERNASESERKAKGYSETASEKADAITGLTATATTLPDGSQASASYNAETGVMSFGIPKGKDGTDGDDGYSPTANVSKSGKVATITITDKNGTTSAQVEDGTDGIDGISPSVSVTDITGGHRVVITDKDGTKSFDVEDGATGATPNLTIGTVETLEPTDDATATITGTAENPVLNFGIPKGDTGEVTTEEFLKAFTTDTASGSIASFSDGADDMPLKSLVVDINPVQDLSQGDPSPENICPISGWTEVDVEQSGKNLFPYKDIESQTQNGVTITVEKSDGIITNIHLQGTATADFSISFASSYKQWVLPKGDYKLYIGGDKPTQAHTFDLNVRKFGTTSDIVARFGETTITLSEQTTFSSAYIWVYSGTVFNHNIIPVIVQNGVNTSVKYPITQRQSITINLGQTVYGGHLDVLSGNLVVDTSFYTPPSDVASWYGGYGGYYYRGNDADFWVNDANRSKMACDVFKVLSDRATMGVYGLDNFLYFSRTNGMWATVQEFAAFASSNVHLVLPLAEPIEIQLDSHTLNSLYGVNNIWADSGDTEVVYRADTKLFIERLTAPDSADMIADANITSGQYFMVGNSLYKATANIANGGQITVGTNCTRVSLAQALNEINA